jgi:hypothetical protein
MDQPQPAIELKLTRAEIELIRTSLGHLEATLGREEAEELEAVQALLARLDEIPRG